MEVDSNGNDAGTVIGDTTSTTEASGTAASSTTGSAPSGGKFPGLSRGGTPDGVADGVGANIDLFDEDVVEEQMVKYHLLTQGR